MRALNSMRASGPNGARGVLATSAVVSRGAVGRSSTCRRRVGSLVNLVRQKRRRSAHDNATRQLGACGRCGQTKVTARRHVEKGSSCENVFLSRTILTVASIMATMRFQPKSHLKTNAWGESGTESAAKCAMNVLRVPRPIACSESGPTGATQTLVTALACVPASDQLRVRTTNAVNPVRVSSPKAKEAAWKRANTKRRPARGTVSSASGRIGAGIQTTANVPKKRASARSFSTLSTVECRAKAVLKKWTIANITLGSASFPCGLAGQSAAPTAARANARSTVTWCVAQDAKVNSV